MKESYFSTEDQQWKWFKAKVEPFESAEHPARRHGDNWMLSEYYFEHKKGKETAVTSTIEESLKRASTDLQSSAALLNVEPDTKAKKGDPEQKHKTMVNKVSAIMKNLGAAILTTEGALPRLRRRIPPTMYNKLKKGLVQARDFKEESMDKVEDLKKRQHD